MGKLKFLNIINSYKVKLEKWNEAKKPIIDIPIYIINLTTNFTRRAYIKQMMQKLNINYTLVIVEPISNFIQNSVNPDCRKGVIGCFLSHLWCIKKCIEENHEYFIILEDDVVFHSNFINLFKQLDYKSYDMVQLGCSDFNLKKNAKYTEIVHQPKDTLRIYNPDVLALGAFANLYNIHFAKLLYKEKMNVFMEFDYSFMYYYRKYNMGVCLPNLLTTELTTTNIDHDFSVFNKSKEFNDSSRFLKSCFYNFKYSDYSFLWIIFINYCYKHYKKKKKLLDVDEYLKVIDEYCLLVDSKITFVKDVLLNNGFDFVDLNKIIITMSRDIYNKGV